MTLGWSVCWQMKRSNLKSHLQSKLLHTKTELSSTIGPTNLLERYTKKLNKKHKSSNYNILKLLCYWNTFFFTFLIWGQYSIICPSTNGIFLYQFSVSFSVAKLSAPGFNWAGVSYEPLRGNKIHGFPGTYMIIRPSSLSQGSLG